MKDSEQELLIVKKTDESTISELRKEIEAMRQDLKRASDLYKTAMNEVAGRDKEVNDLKLEVERKRLQNMDIDKRSSHLEDKIDLLEIKMRAKTPILVQNQRQVDYEAPEREDQKGLACVSELDSMMRKYRTELLNRKSNVFQ